MSSHLDEKLQAVTTCISLTSLSEYYRFHKPGQPNLKYGIRAYYGGTTITRNDAQIIALTLNDICVLRVQGLAYWFSSFMNNVEPRNFRPIVDQIWFTAASSGLKPRKLNNGTALNQTVSTNVIVWLSLCPL